MNRVVIYSKPDCHLCDVVKAVIERVAKSHPLALEIRNILDDPADHERFKTLIPVVFVNGREIARYRLSEAQLTQALVS
ncbi:MAG TPA: glutaredoxin family protein [Tepidisphaeraceae bacterium]|nr:glutaredoxin family protein [Tepidisphaeraceae bacterium]